MHSQLISRQTTNVTLIRFITSLTVDYCFHDNRYQVCVLIWREVLLQLGVCLFLRTAGTWKFLFGSSRRRLKSERDKKINFKYFVGILK